MTETPRSYYGCMDEVSSKFRKEKGVQLYMLDQHVEKLVDKQIERFMVEINELTKEFKKDLLSIKRLTNNIADVKNEVLKLQTQIKPLIDKDKKLDEKIKKSADKLPKSEQEEFKTIVKNIEAKKRKKGRFPESKL